METTKRTTSLERHLGEHSVSEYVGSVILELSDLAAWAPSETMPSDALEYSQARAQTADNVIVRDFTNRRPYIVQTCDRAA